MPVWWIYPVAGAFILSILLTDIVRVLSIKSGVLDTPTKERKRHKKAMPTLGGVAIFFAFLIPTVAVLALTDHFTASEISAKHFIGFLSGGLILIIGGIIDDKFDLKPWQSIVFPVLAALVAAIVGIGPDKITNP